MAKGYIFPGQGAQTVGMGKDLYDESPEARRIIDRAGEILSIDLKRIMFDGPEEELSATDTSQPAILAMSLATVKALGAEADPERVKATAGLSLGEYTALAFAGSLDFEDALRIVRERGRLMQEACDAHPGGMVSIIGLDCDAVSDLVARSADDSVLTVANVNSPEQVVVSGELDALDRLEALAKKAGAKRAVRLKVAGAFHSSLMERAAAGLERVLAGVEIRPPAVPFVSNVSADFVSEPDEIRRFLVRQLTSPVLWSKSMERMIGAGIVNFLEIGPGRVLTGLARRISPDVECVPLGTVRALAEVNL